MAPRSKAGPDVEARGHIIRSLVFVPAYDADVVQRAASSGADAVCFDMEDLTPAPQKARAREIFRPLAQGLAAAGIAVMARTNRLDSGQCEADLEAIVCDELHCVNIPKTESPADVVEFCRLLDKAEDTNGVAPGYTLVRPVVETAAGVKWAYEIAAASERVTYMGGVAGGYWGDLGASVGVIPSDDGLESLFLRSKVLIDVRAAGVRFPIGGGVTARTDVDGVRAFMAQNKQLGYTGAHCANSRAIIAAVNDVFTPTVDEIAEWTRRLPILEQAKNDGRVAFMHDGVMYDIAGLERTYDQLDLARRLGLIS